MTQTSIRKAMTVVATFIFAISCIGYLIANKFSELPASYQAIIAGVFGFYFLKGLAEGKKIKIENNDN